MAVRSRGKNTSKARRSPNLENESPDLSELSLGPIATDRSFGELHVYFYGVAATASLAAMRPWIAARAIPSTLSPPAASPPV